MKKHSTMERFKRLDSNVKQRIETHYAQLEKFRSQYANKRILFFLTLLVVFIAVQYAHHTSIFTIPAPLLRPLQIILSILIVFTISSIIVRLLETRFFRFFENEIEIEKRLFYTKLFTFAVYLSTFLFVLYSLGITLSNLTLVAGLITTAFALSMRDVLGSYMAWMVLLFKRPFRIGDFIKIGDDEGQVEHIGTFFVTIDDGTDNPMRTVKIPTQLFLSRTVVSYGVGDVPETIKVRLHSSPDEKRLEKLATAIKEITGYKDTTVELDVEAEFPLVVVHYEIPFISRKPVKTKVLLKMLDILDDIRKITK